MTEDRCQSAVFGELALALISSGRGFLFRAHGRSMFPTIRDGDILHVVPITGSRLKIGDIVLFRKGAEFKAHRIVGRNGVQFITRGDAGVDSDGGIASSQILGKVIARQPASFGEMASLASPRARFQFFARELRKRFRRCFHPLP